jgi:hypothetical protein
MDNLIALLLGLSVAYYFFSKGTFTLIVWGLIGYLVSLNYLHNSRTISVCVGIALALGVMYWSTREGFEEEDSEGDGEGEIKKKKEPKPKVKRSVRYWCINSVIKYIVKSGK